MHAISTELNKRAIKHPIGALQQIRTKLKGLARQPGHDIFRPNTKTITDRWAFHFGGRSELQFNIGLEDSRGTDELRYGVAFSFETNQTLPSIDILVPQVAVFNDYMLLHPELYQDMRMWHYRDNARSDDSMPGPIPPELEYAFWPGAQEAVRLVVAGETALDNDGKEYLNLLRKRFSIPIEYEQISV